MSTLVNSIYTPIPFSTSNGGTGNNIPLMDGQLWVGNTGNSPSISTLTPGTNVTITNGPGTITIAASGGSSITWIHTISSPIALEPSNGYIIIDGSTPEFQTPPVAMPGDTYIIMGASATSGFTVQTIPSFPQNFYYNGTLGTILSTTSNSAAITIVCLLGPPGPIYWGVLSTNDATFTLT